MSNGISAIAAVELFRLCERFIKDHGISCPETINQTDKVIEDAYGLIEDICNIVGYAEDEED